MSLALSAVDDNTKHIVVKGEIAHNVFNNHL